MSDLDRTLTQLEGHDWGPPTYDSFLVTECHRLRHVPLAQLTVEDLRLLIGQQIGLAHLVPLAIERLVRDPWAEGIVGPGDLLKAVVEVPGAFWEEHPTLITPVQGVLNEVEKRHRYFQQVIVPAWNRVFGGA